MTIRIGSPLPHRHPLAGLGFQSDSLIYSEQNRQLGVTEDDCLLWERRVEAMRPSVARIFVSLGDFSPPSAPRPYTPESPGMQRELRNLRSLQRAGAGVLLCIAPWSAGDVAQPGREEAAVDLVQHLVVECGFDNIRWLSLYNEPDGMYGDSTDAYKSVYAEPDPKRRTWEQYVDQHRRTLELLAARGLTEQVRLSLPDVVMGPAIRLSRLQMAARDFAGAGDRVSYGFHHYSSAYDGYYDHPDSGPWKPFPGEVAGYRGAVGDEHELICWETNDFGYCGGTFSVGVGPHGEDHSGSLHHAVQVCRKSMTFIEEGCDGVAIWCSGDMNYSLGDRPAMMLFGFWRFKWDHWFPRPVYYYYAALIGALRAGDRLCAVEGVPGGLDALAVETGDGERRLILLNPGKTAIPVDLPAGGTQLRVMPSTLPRFPDVPPHATPGYDMPLDTWEPADAASAMEPEELRIIRLANG